MDYKVNWNEDQLRVFFNRWTTRLNWMRHERMTPEQRERHIDLFAAEDATAATGWTEGRIGPRVGPREDNARVDVDAPDIPAVARNNPEGWERFLEHKRHFRIPQHATYGGIHRRLCGYARCDRRGGEMGVRFVNRRYRCEEHEHAME